VAEQQRRTAKTSARAAPNSGDKAIVAALKVLGILFLWAGLWLLWFGGSQYLAARRLGERATGTVIALRESRSVSEIGGRRRVSVTYAPVVRYSVPGRGAPVEFVSGHGSAPPRFRVGETVPVAYDPADPAGKAEIGEFGSLGFLPSLAGGMGLLFSLLGLVAFYGAARERRERADSR
jgi:hypothetical protein